MTSGLSTLIKDHLATIVPWNAGRPLCCLRLACRHAPILRSGGRTVHLGPGETRRWSFTIPPVPTPFAVLVTYANGQEGENEMIDVALVSSFRDRDSGDAVEGWNLFVTDTAGRSALAAGTHALSIGVRGGDGCVEIDLITLVPER